MLREYGLPVAALMLFLGELGIPTGPPIEVTLLIVGSHGIGSLPHLLLGVSVLSAADVAGTALLHVASRTGGLRVLNRIAGGHEARSLAAMERWRRRLGGRDALVVFVLRLVPLVRLGVTIGTGLLRIRRRDFFLGAVPVSVVWASGPLSLGYLFRDNVRAIEERYAAASRGLLLGVAAAVAVAVVAGWARGAGSPAGALRRVRVGLGLAVGFGGLAYVIRTAQRIDGIGDGLPVGWSLALAALALALLAAAYADLRVERAARRVRVVPPAGAGLAAADKANTAAWAVAVAVVGAIVVAVERGATP